jgi:hypothetical protein
MASMKKLLIAGFGDIARRAADTRTCNLLAALATGGILPARVAYVSTKQPQTDRARRRVPVLRVEDDVHSNHIPGEAA